MLGIKKDEKKFIVYKHLNAETKVIFYIGIGVPGREKQKIRRSLRWISYVNKYGFEYEILFTDLNWYEACFIEKKLIKDIGRKDFNKGELINMTNGGDGSAGHIYKPLLKKRDPISETTRQKLIDNNCKYWIGKNHSDETKGKISFSLKGRKLPQETIEKLKGRIPWNKGKKGVQVNTKKGKKYGPLTSEWKRKISLSNTGKKRTEECRKKLSAIHKGKVVSFGTREKIRNTLLLRKRSIC